MVLDRAVLQLSNKHRACATITFAAADLGSRQVLLVADDVQYHRAFRLIALHERIVQDEGDHIGRGFHVMPNEDPKFGFLFQRGTPYFNKVTWPMRSIRSPERWSRQINFQT